MNPYPYCSFPDHRQSVSSLSGPLQVVPDIDDQVNHPEQEVNYIPSLIAAKVASILGHSVRAFNRLSERERVHQKENVPTEQTNSLPSG